MAFYSALKQPLFPQHTWGWGLQAQPHPWPESTFINSQHQGIEPSFFLFGAFTSGVPNSPLWSADPHQDSLNSSGKGDSSKVKDSGPVPYNLRNLFVPTQIYLATVAVYQGPQGEAGHIQPQRKVLLYPSPGLPVTVHFHS